MRRLGSSSLRNLTDSESSLRARRRRRVSFASRAPRRQGEGKGEDALEGLDAGRVEGGLAALRARMRRSVSGGVSEKGVGQGAHLGRGKVDGVAGLLEDVVRVRGLGAARREEGQRGGTRRASGGGERAALEGEARDAQVPAGGLAREELVVRGEDEEDVLQRDGEEERVSDLRTRCARCWPCTLESVPPLAMRPVAVPTGRREDGRDGARHRGGANEGARDAGRRGGEGGGGGRRRAGRTLLAAMVCR